MRAYARCPIPECGESFETDVYLRPDDQTGFISLVDMGVGEFTVVSPEAELHISKHKSDGSYSKALREYARGLIAQARLYENHERTSLIYEEQL